MAFKTFSRNQQRRVEASNNTCNPVGRKEQQKELAEWVKNWMRKEDRKKNAALRNPLSIDSAQKALKALDKEKKAKKKKLVRLYANIVICMLAYSQDIPLPPKKLKASIGRTGPEEWVKGFVNWPDAFVHFQDQQKSGVIASNATLFTPKFLTLKQYEKTVWSFKCRIVRAHLMNKKMPKISDVLKHQIDKMDLWVWVNNEDDFAEVLKYVRQKIAEQSEHKIHKKG